MNTRSLAARDGRIYTSYAKVTIDDTLEHSLFSPTYKGRGLLIPKNTLREGDSYRIKFNGLFSTATGATSTHKVYFGNLLITMNAGYALNRVNYYIEQELLITVRSVGINGTLIFQGRTMTQDDSQYHTSVAPIMSTLPIALNTTIDNQIEQLFKWNTAGQSLIVSNATIEKI